MSLSHLAASTTLTLVVLAFSCSTETADPVVTRTAGASGFGATAANGGAGATSGTGRTGAAAGASGASASSRAGETSTVAGAGGLSADAGASGSGATAGWAGSDGAAGAGGGGGAVGSSGAGAGKSGAGGEAGAGSGPVEPDHWVGTWGASQQLTETNNNPPSPGLANNTLRQLSYVSIGGSTLRVQLSNEFGSGPATMNSVHLAASDMDANIDVATDVELSFSGSTSVTIPAGEAVYSDPFDFNLEEQSSVAITIHFGDVPTGITGHPGSRTISHLAAGNAAAEATFSNPAWTEHWYYISRIEVMAPVSAAAVVALGDSLTDGRGSFTNENNRWPDNLSRRLRGNAATRRVAVINAGIGGNALVSGGLGPPARDRFERDVLGQAGVRWVIVLEGVNDIGGAGMAVATNLIATYQDLIDAAHDANVLIYGVPILPFGGSAYDTPENEAARQAVNDWMRSAGRFDDLIDLELVVADPVIPTQLLSSYDSGDHLHLSVAGYQSMADAIDLTLFVR